MLSITQRQRRDGCYNNLFYNHKICRILTIDKMKIREYCSWRKMFYKSYSTMDRHSDTTIGPH